MNLAPGTAYGGLYNQTQYGKHYTTGQQDPNYDHPQLSILAKNGISTRNVTNIHVNYAVGECAKIEVTYILYDLCR